MYDLIGSDEAVFQQQHVKHGVHYLPPFETSGTLQNFEIFCIFYPARALRALGLLLAHSGTGRDFLA